jgi:hypothetical protein
MGILLGYFNACVWKEDIFKLRVDNENLREISNDNRVRVVYFATSKKSNFQEYNVSKSQQL